MALSSPQTGLSRQVPCANYYPAYIMQLKLNNLTVLRFSSVSLSCMEVRSITMDAKCFGLVHQTPAILGVSISSFFHIQVCLLLVPGGLGQFSFCFLVLTTLGSCYS